MSTYVLVHGGWDGGWAWRQVARELQSSGHEVFTPTLTGSGERVHLASPAVGLDTHILDVVNVFRYENLSEVILVGFSYGGMVITGVAEQVPEQIGQLIYLDAFVPEDGQSAADLSGPEITGVMEQIAQSYGDGWRIPHNPPDADRRTNLLLKAAHQRLTVNNPQARRLKHSYVQFTAKPPEDFTRPIMARMAARVRQEGWTYREMPFGHFSLLDEPQAVARLLLELV
jgi:pimeloyl-ACP methyl ester carboxylesterase